MRIYVVGDSISNHYGPYLQACLKGVMAYSRKEGEAEALLNLDKPQGANGGDSGMVLSFLKASARSGGIDADLLLLNCGLHDTFTCNLGPDIYCDHVHFHDPVREKQAAFIAGWLSAFIDR